MKLHEHEIEIRVRYQETDAMGVLHHANYFTYFEMGRTELLRANGVAYRDVEQAGVLLVVIEAQCKYRRPARYDDLLRLRTTLAQANAVKIVHTYRLLRGDELLAEGRTTLACVDRKGNLQRIPEWLRAEPLPPHAAEAAQASDAVRTDADF